MDIQEEGQYNNLTKGSIVSWRSYENHNIAMVRIQVPPNLSYQTYQLQAANHINHQYKQGKWCVGIHDLM